MDDCNILELCDDGVLYSFNNILSHSDYNVTYKYNTKNISIVSYDIYIIGINFFINNYLDNMNFFEKIIDTDKPVIFIYDDEDIITDNDAITFLEDRFKIKFDLTDGSVIEKGDLLYNPCFANNNEGYAIISDNFKGFLNVKNTTKYFMAKKDNITFLHDCYILFSDSFSPYEIRNKEYNYVMSLISCVFKNCVYSLNAKHCDGIDKINILDDCTLKQQQKDISLEIDKLLKKKAQIEQKLSINDDYKRVLFLSGDDLVKIVKRILYEMLSIKITDEDVKKEDLFFILDNINILVEVKGVNQPFKRENISQITRHIKDYAEKNKIFGEDVKKKCKGLLIINPYISNKFEDRIKKEFYSKEVISDAKYDNICTLDTFTLLSLYSSWKKDYKSVDLKDIILNNTYNEPNFSNIISD